MDKKEWESAWTPQKVRQNAEKWKLSGDAGLLLYLEESSNRLFESFQRTETTLRTLNRDLKFTGVRLENTINDFSMLSNKQFIENRVYDEDLTVVKPQIKKDIAENAKTKEQREAEMFEAVKYSLQKGCAMIDNCFEKIEIRPEDFDEDDDPTFRPDPIYEPKVRPVTYLKTREIGKKINKDPFVRRQLPFIIGTISFESSNFIGLRDEETNKTSDGNLSDEETEEILKLPTKNHTVEPSHDPPTHTAPVKAKRSQRNEPEPNDKQKFEPSVQPRLNPADEHKSFLSDDENDDLFSNSSPILPISNKIIATSMPSTAQEAPSNVIEKPTTIFDGDDDEEDLFSAPLSSRTKNQQKPIASVLDDIFSSTKANISRKSILTQDVPSESKSANTSTPTNIGNAGDVLSTPVENTSKNTIVIQRDESILTSKQASEMTKGQSLFSDDESDDLFSTKPPVLPVLSKVSSTSATLVSTETSKETKQKIRPISLFDDDDDDEGDLFTPPPLPKIKNEDREPVRVSKPSPVAETPSPSPLSGTQIDPRKLLAQVMISNSTKNIPEIVEAKTKESNETTQSADPFNVENALLPSLQKSRPKIPTASRRLPTKRSPMNVESQNVIESNKEAEPITSLPTEIKEDSSSDSILFAEKSDQKSLLMNDSSANDDAKIAPILTPTLTPVAKKEILLSDDENDDLFSNLSQIIPVSNKMIATSVPSVARETTTNRTEKSTSIFDSDDDEDLFSAPVPSRTKNQQKPLATAVLDDIFSSAIESDSRKSILTHNVQSEGKPTEPSVPFNIGKVERNESNPIDKLPKNANEKQKDHSTFTPKSSSVMTKGESLFSDDDNDDLFSTKPPILSVAKKVSSTSASLVTTQPSKGTKENIKPISLFDDDDDDEDLFSTNK